MKRGIDVGNYSVKEWISKDVYTNIKSLVTTEENLLGSTMSIEYDDKKFYIGEGNFETELNKASKTNFLPLLLTSIALNSGNEVQQIVCGLPINQYKNNKDILKEMVLENRMRKVILNGEPKQIIISDFEVYPEGIGVYYSLNTVDDIVIVCIGGRTTEIVYVVNGKVKISSTVAVGTLNIYKDIADKLNSLYTLDLGLLDAEKIIEKGYLQVDGDNVDLSFIIEILKKNFDKINEDLMMKFPVRNEKLAIAGGGYKLFSKAFNNRYKNSFVVPNPVFANAIGFREVANRIW
jgi:plasmid segregation protein ParM